MYLYTTSVQFEIDLISTDLISTVGKSLRWTSIFFGDNTDVSRIFVEYRRSFDDLIRFNFESNRCVNDIVRWISNQFGGISNGICRIFVDFIQLHAFLFTYKITYCWADDWFHQFAGEKWVMIEFMLLFFLRGQLEKEGWWTLGFPKL